MQAPQGTQAAADVAAKAAGARGFASTIVTSPEGLKEEASTTKKALTGQ